MVPSLSDEPAPSKLQARSVQFWVKLAVGGLLVDVPSCETMIVVPSLSVSGSELAEEA